MFAILVIFTSNLCISDFCYKRTDPMPMDACIEFAKQYNESKMYLTSGAYCEAIELITKKEKE